MLSHVRLFATPRTLAHQAPPSVGFSRQEHWRQKGKIPPEQKRIQAEVSRHPVLTPIPPPPEAEAPACEASPVEADKPRSSAHSADTAVCGVTPKAMTTPPALARPRNRKGKKRWFCSWDHPISSPSPELRSIFTVKALHACICNLSSCWLLVGGGEGLPDCPHLTDGETKAGQLK